MTHSSPIGLVCSTSRPFSKTSEIVRLYRDLLESQFGLHSEIFDLQELPVDFLTSILYQAERSSHSEWDAWQAKVDATDKFVFVIPEYNGSFPGILKCFVDALHFPRSLRGKKASMVGISNGTQGAALAMSHFGDVLNYAGVTTLPLRPRLIEINKHWDGKGFTQPAYHHLLLEHIRQTVAM
jgi:NAD(P)H-dependent FMN reductase